ncbi:hypothetical protein MBLNU459_g4703t1 [Dothideomycetes sp. NU459]
MSATRAEVTDDGQARGVKRTADDSLDDDQRFAKRFDLLNLLNNGKLYIPVQRSAAAAAAAAAASPQLHAPKPGPDERMQVDDTRDRVYIHSLDDELADTESDEEKIVFLPDIEARLNRIPKHILTGQKPSERDGQELVLYTEPVSLSVPSAQDSVRKAVLEARQRARDKVSEAARLAAAEERYSHGDIAETAHGFGEDDYVEDRDDDAHIDDRDGDAMDVS